MVSVKFTVKGTDTVMSELLFQREKGGIGKPIKIFKMKNKNKNKKNKKKTPKNKNPNTWKRRHSKLYRYTIHC